MPKMWELEEGKMTVEASFVVPVTIFILALLLCFFFYAYESGTAAGLLVEALSQAGNEVDDETRVSDCEAYIRKNMQLRSVFGNQMDVVVQEKMGCIYGTIENYVPVFDIRQRCVAKISKPAEELRRWQQLE